MGFYGCYFFRKMGEKGAKKSEINEGEQEKGNKKSKIK